MAFQNIKIRVSYSLSTLEFFEIGSRFTLNQNFREHRLSALEQAMTKKEKQLLEEAKSRLKSEDGKILEETYKTLKADGCLSKKDFEKLEGIDEILESADIIINRQTGDATIITDEGETKEIEFDNNSSKPSGGRMK